MTHGELTMQLGQVAKALVELHVEYPDRFPPTEVLAELLKKYEQLAQLNAEWAAEDDE